MDWIREGLALRGEEGMGRKGEREGVGLYVEVEIR